MMSQRRYQDVTRLQHPWVVIGRDHEETKYINIICCENILIIFL
jgi:hypothetical protein